MPPCEITVEVGDAALWNGSADAVLTNPYGPLPKCLYGKPMIISMYEGKGERRALAEAYCDTEMRFMGRWGKDCANSIYLGNIPFRRIRIDDLVEAPYKPAIGWFPLELPMRLLREYADLIPPGSTVWDGFCGRATTGRACQQLGMNFIGLDIDPARVRMAKEFLGIE